jgi:NACHT domain
MSGIEYYFNNLNYSDFQRLINSILVARFGEHVRLTPLQGSDGGKDGETAPYNPYFEFRLTDIKPPYNGISQPPEKGRYLFQVKHHHTTNTRLSDARRMVISDFEKEIEKNVLSRQKQERVNFFFLITNVPSSERSIAQVNKIAVEIRAKYHHLYIDIWWEERVKAFLDQMPSLWRSFPNLFAGNKIPFLAEVTQHSSSGLPRAVRMALDRQYVRDNSIKFRQIGLTGQEKNLSKLFTGLDINIQTLPVEEQQEILAIRQNKKERLYREGVTRDDVRLQYSVTHYRGPNISALELLMDETCSSTRKIILEGGPGQGKSTLTQILTQIYRQQLLGQNDMDSEGRWEAPEKARHPFRIELRKFAEWLSKKSGESIEEYLAFIIKQDSAGNPITVEDIHNMVEESYILLVLDGLDEVGNDDLRNEVLVKASDCIYRFESNLHADLRVIITTRPPTVSNCKEYLTDFKRFTIAPMATTRIEEYVKRWLSVQIQDEDDRRDVQDSFEKRQHEPHVQALIKNPMQLSVLLHFIQFKGLAFPDHRAELYKEYFGIVIDRDVEKSPILREQRETIEALHRFLGYKIHVLTEAKQADGSLTYIQLLQLVNSWLVSRGNSSKTAQELFKLGEERLGLIVALKGEGEETRYGYEIQPIREYFAAAFINDDIQGDAHKVFEIMIRRSFWKEVAIFLAGLRRPNEKADLIARAKALDEDTELGWRQDGKSVILQLLQEGNFSEPPHLYSNALDFIFDTLDPQLVRVQNEPKELFKSLPSLIKQEAVKGRYSERLIRLLQEYKSSRDEYLVYRLYLVASQVLETRKVRKELLAYQGDHPNLIAKVRLLWPSIWKINLEEAMQSQSFWEELPDHVWSQNLWYAIFRYNNVSIFSSLPTRFHKQLLENFAINPFPFGRVSYRLQMSAKHHSKWAVWVLINYQMLFIYNEFDLNQIRRLGEEKYTDLLDPGYASQVDFVGLSNEESLFVGDLIKASDSIVRAAFIGENENQADVFENYILTVKGYLSESGLIGWLAYRCATNFFMSTVVHSGRINPSLFPWRNRELLLSFWRGTRDFMPRSLVPLEETGEETEIFRFIRSELYSPTFLSRGIPNYIRLKKNGELVSIVELVGNYLCDGKDLPFNWIMHISFANTVMLHSLIESCKDDIPALLTTIEATYFTPHPSINLDEETYLTRAASFERISSLSGADIQRILKVMRRTDDSTVLSGGLITLSSSKFMRSAGVNLSLKMMRAASEKVADIIENIFDRRFYDQLDRPNREILDEVARSIIKCPNEYAFQVVCAAAAYLAEYPFSGLSSLLSIEDELGLYIHVQKN